jgi:hypothetical protein
MTLPRPSDPRPGTPYVDRLEGTLTAGPVVAPDTGLKTPGLKPAPKLK